MKKILIVLLSFMIIGCAVNENQTTGKDNYPKLQIVNDSEKPDNNFDIVYYIARVSLVNYVFEPLYLSYGESQTFVLDNGMPAGYNDIQVVLTYNADSTGTMGSIRKVKKSFKNGKTTVVKLSETSSYVCRQ